MLTRLLSKQKKKCTKYNYISDDSIITLVSTIINGESKFNAAGQICNKGIWAWNVTKKRFACSPGLYHILNISTETTPDLDFWLEKLAPDDLVKFADALYGIRYDSKPRNFIFQIIANDSGKTIKCFMESLTNPMNNTNYIIGVFCDISENIFPRN